MSNARDIIVRPLVTEKTIRSQEGGNTVVFEVRKGTNKIQIKQAIEEAGKAAVASSLKVTGACVRIMKLAYTTVTEGNRMMVTDGSASALLARACQQVAAYNVRINLGGVKDKAVAAEAEQLLERHLSEGERLQAEVLKEVDKRL